jgi:hypothetical protein
MKLFILAHIEGWKFLILYYSRTERGMKESLRTRRFKTNGSDIICVNAFRGLAWAKNGRNRLNISARRNTAGYIAEDSNGERKRNGRAIDFDQKASFTSDLFREIPANLFDILRCFCFCESYGKQISFVHRKCYRVRFAIASARNDNFGTRLI